MRSVVLDTETTGMPVGDGHRIIEIGCVELMGRRPTGRHFHVYLQPDREVDEGAIAVHGITNDFLVDKPRFKEVADEFFDFVQARLGIVVGPSPEMADLVRSHHLGVVLDDFTGEALAAALDDLDDADVAGFKAAAHAAARKLSAEEQVRGWVRAVDTLAARVNG